MEQSLIFMLQALINQYNDEMRTINERIQLLEEEYSELQLENKKTKQENQDLRDRLDHLSAEAKTSEETIRAQENEIERLEKLTAHVESLQEQLAYLEREQVVLQENYVIKLGEERTAAQGWGMAKREIAELEDRIDRIEAEARAEQARHQDIVERMSRKIAESGVSANGGRGPGRQNPEQSASTLSQFVEGILMNNANLQREIMELRQLLHNSYQEVETHRLQAHQHASQSVEDTPHPTNLQNELGTEPIVNQELHIHHHYYGGAPKKDSAKANSQRRSRKKRISLYPSNFAPLVPQDVSSTDAMLSEASATVPPNTQRWSNATTLAPSSMPGSPLSVSHRGSIHDKVFSDSPYDSSRPTSPSESITSPMFAPQHAQLSLARRQKRKSQSLKPPSLSTIRSSSSPISLTTKSSPATAIISAASPSDSLNNNVFLLSPPLRSAIPEEEGGLATLETPNEEDDFDLDAVSAPITPRPSVLRRAASHESLISVSGMDIHTLQSRPSQLLFSTSPGLTSPSFGQSSQPALSHWAATATARMSRHNFDSTAYNKSLLYGSRANHERGVHTPRKDAASGGIGKALKVGGWVLGKWGATSARSSPHAEPSFPVPKVQVASSVKSDTSSTQPASIKGPKTKTKEISVRLRPPGVNQSGPIWGFFDIPPTPTKIVVTDLDADALEDALAGP